MSDRRRSKSIHGDVIWRKNRVIEGTQPGPRRWTTPDQVLKRIRELEHLRALDPIPQAQIERQRAFAQYYLNAPHGDRSNARSLFSQQRHDRRRKAFCP